MTVLPLLLVVMVLLGAVTVELGAHLVARARAAQLADAAALAAVSAPVAPEDAAREVVHAGGGVLERCDCPPGATRASAVVGVEVAGPARLVGLPRQQARADAVLTGPGYPATPTARADVDRRTLGAHPDRPAVVVPDGPIRGP